VNDGYDLETKGEIEETLLFWRRFFDPGRSQLTDRDRFPQNPRESDVRIRMPKIV
jgi:hypothetical protein